MPPSLRELLNSWRALYLIDMEKLEITNPQDVRINQRLIIDKINEIVEWCNELDIEAKLDPSNLTGIEIKLLKK